ncbi:uncharacterized protein LOC6728955 [Drosophila simulans]|uniref:GD20880 n=1 Tax=Drosophila simulans TaxID=7240 RepID=B4QYM8_DROSI|nr:uncharacterized protein LOC6728955 [Drosophila simulans]EDX13786.1 GD20880 [Drosophila simulans]KMZ04924.1 uncharacterized protein Dsimw501_GD20880 [Drosophila simulans]
MMSQTLGVLALLMLTWADCQEVRYETKTETTNYGPVTMVVDNLAEIAVSVSDDTTIQLEEKINRTRQNIAGNIEVLTANAMAELSDVIYETNQLVVSNPDCNPAWSLDELNENVTRQLGGCTEDLGSLLEDFRLESQLALARVQEFVQQIAHLPAKCQMLGASPLNPLASAGGSVCFINAMAEINLGMAQSMHNASLILVQTHQTAEDQVEQAQLCSAMVVQQIGDYLREEQDQCRHS